MNQDIEFKRVNPVIMCLSKITERLFEKNFILMLHLSKGCYIYILKIKKEKDIYYIRNKKYKYKDVKEERSR